MCDCRLFRRETPRNTGQLICMRNNRYTFFAVFRREISPRNQELKRLIWAFSHNTTVVLATIVKCQFLMVKRRYIIILLILQQMLPYGRFAFIKSG